jgi:hypothetical protein
MGVLLVIVMIMMVATSGPAAMSVKPARLPALATGGGTNTDPLAAPRAGTTAVNAAAGTARTRAARGRTVKPASRARTRARVNAAWIIVGSGRVRRNVQSGGIPSPAAAANLAVAGGGRVAAGSTGAVQLHGIPSPAAAENLGPKTLPYRPSDGVTLPRMVGERDSHAVDSHYGRDTLPMEQAVASPALTPGAAAEQAQQRAVLADMGANPGAYAAQGNGGGFSAY